MRKNILLLIVLVTIMYVLWNFGLQFVYIHFLNFGVNIVLAFFNDISTSIVYQDGHPLLEMSLPTIIEGKQYIIKPVFPLTPVVLPFALLFTWQIFLFFHLPAKRALKLTMINIGIFYFFQILFAMLLFDYDGKVEFFTILKDTFLHGFAIVVLFLCAKDVYLYRFMNNDPFAVFKKQKS